jgi:excisionase family DNA binding protein
MIYSPKTLAHHWGCSEKHVRKLISSGKLQAFRLGTKLLRIEAHHVEEFKCSHIPSGASEASSASYITTPGESGTGTSLAPLTRARLSSLRQQSTQS